MGSYIEKNGRGIGAGLAAASGFIGAEKKRTEQIATAAQLDAQAKAGYYEADRAKTIAELDATRIDRQKSALRRQYNDLMGRNRVDLAAGNVDATSGSAREVAEGNAQLFANDMAENAYAAALKRWEGEETRKALRFRAEQYDAQSSYLEQTSGNLLSSLLTAGMAGATSYFSRWW